MHEQQPILHHGAALAQARAAMIMIHGRGASAEDILSLSAEFAQPDVAYLAPQAAGHTWYPNRFIAPVATNEPHLGSALATLDALVAHVAGSVPHERVLLLGFSQGACLALEYAARHPRRYGGVIALSGALIENGDQPRDYSGALAGTPVFLGCSDVDAHIPLTRVRRSTQVLQALGATVTERIYPGMGHTVNADELTFVRELLAGVATTPRA
jgi:phospholipase/carboxylesterase